VFAYKLKLCAGKQIELGMLDKKKKPSELRE